MKKVQPTTGSWMMRRFVSNASELGDADAPRSSLGRLVDRARGLAGTALLMGLAGLAVVATSSQAEAQEIQLTGPLAGAPAVPITGVELATWQRPRISPDGKQLMLVRGYQQVIALPLDSSTPARVVWNAGTGSVSAAAWTSDGAGIVAAVGGYEGDLWLADGTFP